MAAEKTCQEKKKKSQLICQTLRKKADLRAVYSPNPASKPPVGAATGSVQCSFNIYEFQHWNCATCTSSHDIS